MDIKNLIRKNIADLKPYSTARDEFEGVAEVYLDANENPFDTGYNRYPDPHQRKLKNAIARIKGVTADKIFLGNGSDEAIDLLIRAFCEPALDSILIAEPTYGMYNVCASINNVSVKCVSLNTDYELNVHELKSVMDDTVKIIFLCSPNNPTGNLLSKDAVLDLVNSFSGLVVVDEAYIDFANDVGYTPYLDRYPNLVILQTFSKAWGLAALRLGICLANPQIIEILNKIKYPYNISSVTQELVLDRLQDEEKKNQFVREIVQQREVVISKLVTMNLVQKIFPSNSNFILVKVDQAKKLYQYLLENKIIVRDRSNVRLCEDCLRITIGTASENQKLIIALKNYEESIIYRS